MKCNKCKHELPPEAAFCRHCGTSVEAIKEKAAKKKRLLILLAAVAAGLILAAVCVGAILSGRESARMSLSISAANVAAGGDVATCGDKVYLISDETVYATDPAFRSKKKLFSYDGIDCICADEKAIYFISSQYESGSYVFQLHEYRFADKKTEKLADLDKKSSQLGVCGDYLYFVQDQKLMAYQLSAGQMSVAVDESIRAYSFAADGLYYVVAGKDHALMHMAAPGAEAKQAGSLPGNFFANLDMFYLWGTKLYARYADYNEGFMFFCSGYEVDLASEDGEYVQMDGAKLLYPAKGGICYLIGVDPAVDSELQAFIDYYYDYVARQTMEEYPLVYDSIYDSKLKEGVEARLHLSAYGAGRMYFSADDDTSVKGIRSDSRYYNAAYLTSAGLLLRQCQTGTWEFLKP
ncbi:MAG: DUF5050 domain-containing protein [Clostridia bacterium]|nr:DUF5050 domain-containing protein [Clostridia bacterium]